jgi:hypothetical protein
MARSGGGSENLTWRPALVAAIMQMPRGLVLSLTLMALEFAVWEKLFLSWTTMQEVLAKGLINPVLHHKRTVSKGYEM